MLLNKYNIDFKNKDVKQNIQRLTNQLWKLIPMRENNENWQKQLETVILEVTGLSNIFLGASLIQLLSKLEGLLAIDEISFDIYRKTIFECIRLLQESIQYE